MQLALAGGGAGALTHHLGAAAAAHSVHDSALPASVQLAPVLPHPKPNKTTARSVPAFLNKLFTMVSDPATDDLIRWSDDGDSFFVPSADRFGKELLPRFFKHSNFGSFVRQLNMYGFHKVPQLSQGVLKSDGGEAAEMLEFSNPNFTRAQPDLLFFIRRHKAKGDSNNHASTSAASTSRLTNTSLAGPSGSHAATSHSNSTALDLPTLLTDLSAIRKHQTAISADLKDLQQSNQLLWQEALASREKHRKQEDTINKILRFLAGVFGGQVLDTSQQQQNHANGTAGTSTGPEGGVTSPGAESIAESVGSQQSTDARASDSRNKGKRKASTQVVAMQPRPRSQLLLEDVKGRQQQRAAALRELDGSDDDDDEHEHEDPDEDDIEEIPLLQRDDFLPTISSSSSRSAGGSSGLPPTPAPDLSRPSPPINALTRTGSSSQALSSPSRFTSLPPASPNPFSNFDFSALSPETMQQFLSAATAGGSTIAPPSANPFASLFSSNLPTSSSSSSSLSLAPDSTSQYDLTSSSSMIPTSVSAFNPTTTSNPLGSSITALPSNGYLPALSPTFVSSMNDHDEVMRSVINEKQDIDRRTTELEDQISKLLQTLPAETRDQVLENDGLPLGTASGLGTTVEEKGGFDWGNAAGENGELDLDKLLEQFTNAPTPQASGATPNGSTMTGELDPTLSTMDYSAFFPDPSSTSTNAVSTPTATPHSLYESTAGTLPFPSDVDQSNPITFPYEVTSPSTTTTTTQSPRVGNVASPVVSEVDGSTAGIVTTRGRKRKSDAIAIESGSPAPPSPAAPTPREPTRKSARKRTQA
ncbi:heat shock factor family protein [Sporobolomyces koalae]|uniref:heat shock factor family protein n=1 Tax=Sporobolomyces koalae TaxID=500713 RepID=UPI0031771316